MPAEVTAPLSVDALRLARSAEVLAGEFAARTSTRLREYLADPQCDGGRIQYRISAAFDHRQRPLIHCIITGYLELACQRCLQPIEFSLNTEARLVAVASESAMPAPAEEEDDVDFIVAAPKFDAVALIEDEIILSLPLAPKHAYECANPAQPSSQ